MSDWLSFEGRIEWMLWGKATYSVLRVPDDIARALEDQGVRRVEGEMNDHPINLALTRAPVVNGVFLWAGKSLLDRTGVAVGDPVDVRLRPAPADQVDTPEDLAFALRIAGLTDAWEALTPGKRRGVLYQIESAKTAPTRAKRISRVLDLMGKA